MADVVRSYTRAQDHDGSWDYEYPYDGDTQTHGLMYEDTTTGEWKDISSDLPYDVFYESDYDTTYYIYSTNGAWVEHNTGCIFDCSGWGWGPDITFSNPNLAPGDTTNKLTINGKEVDIQVGDCILLYNESADDRWDIYPGNILHNFVVSKIRDDYYDYYSIWTTAWYVSPGVWSNASGANDPTHRIVFANCPGDENGDHGYVNSFYDGPPYQRVVHWFEVEPADLSADDTRNPITVNGQTITAEYGYYFDIVEATDACDSNLNATIDARFPQNGGCSPYIYPGIWADCNCDPPYVAEYSYIYHEEVKGHVQLKWTDPPDLTDWDPYPCTWEGTVIVRKEDSPPLHRWDGEKVVRTTTRDKYKTEPYKDEDIVSGKTYYYAFMPYYTRYDDPDHPIRYYTFTKVIKVEIGDKSLSSTIDSIDVDGTNATINYTLSQPDGGSFTSIKMYGKIGKNPKCDNTDDIVLDVNETQTSIIATGLQAKSVYYFCLVTNDTNNKKLSSNVMSCTIGDPIPEDLRPYVKLINDTTGFTYDVFGGFTMYDYDIPVDGTNPDFDPHCRNYSWINYTYQYYPGISTYGQVVDNNYTTSTLQPVGILDINIDTSEFRITSNNVPTYMVFSTKPGRYYYRYYSGSYFYHYPCDSNAINVNTYPVSYVSQGYISGYLQLDLTNQNFTSLDYCVKYVAANYRNVNLYVDGVLWTTANNDS